MSVEDTLKERGERYGDFSDHAKLCQDLKNTMMCFVPANWPTSCPWVELSPVQRQALEVIADKIARILSGDPNYSDNWHDIQGYAKLVEDRLPKDENNKLPEAFRKFDGQQKETWRCNHGLGAVTYENWDAAAAHCGYCAKMKPLVALDKYCPHHIYKGDHCMDCPGGKAQ